MTKTEILAELPKLTPAELTEVQAKLDELTGDGWTDNGQLSEADKAALDEALAEYKKYPGAVSSWAEVQARIRAKLHP